MKTDVFTVNAQDLDIVSALSLSMRDNGNDTHSSLMRAFMIVQDDSNDVLIDVLFDHVLSKVRGVDKVQLRSLYNVTSMDSLPWDRARRISIIDRIIRENPYIKVDRSEDLLAISCMFENGHHTFSQLRYFYNKLRSL